VTGKPKPLRFLALGFLLLLAIGESTSTIARHCSIYENWKKRCEKLASK